MESNLCGMWGMPSGEVSGMGPKVANCFVVSKVSCNYIVRKCRENDYKCTHDMK